MSSEREQQSVGISEEEYLLLCENSHIDPESGKAAEDLRPPTASTKRWEEFWEEFDGRVDQAPDQE